MIRDRLSRLFASTAPGARAAGLVDGAAALASRHRTHRAAWAPHLRATRELIRTHVASAYVARPIVVLGAGLGRDLPLDALAAHRGGARLVDAVLLPVMRWELRAWPSLRFEVHDVTGLLAHPDAAEDPPSPAPLPIRDAGMLVSVNLLSQLVLSFAKSPPETARDRLVADRIWRAHLAALREANCPVLLVTDTAREETRGDELTSIDTVPRALIDEYFPAGPIAAWDWLVAPPGELGPDVSVIFKVGAWLRLP